MNNSIKIKLLPFSAALLALTAILFTGPVNRITAS